MTAIVCELPYCSSQRFVSCVSYLSLSRNMSSRQSVGSAVYLWTSEELARLGWGQINIANPPIVKAYIKSRPNEEGYYERWLYIRGLPLNIADLIMDFLPDGVWSGTSFGRWGNRSLIGYDGRNLLLLFRITYTYRLAASAA